MQKPAGHPRRPPELTSVLKCQRTTDTVPASDTGNSPIVFDPAQKSQVRAQPPSVIWTLDIHWALVICHWALFPSTLYLSLLSMRQSLAQKPRPHLRHFAWFA